MKRESKRPSRLSWAFHVVSAMAVPLVAVGLISDRSWLVVLGLALFALFVIDTTILWPIRMARRREHGP